jgi:hypothetical protein
MLISNDEDEPAGKAAVTSDPNGIFQRFNVKILQLRQPGRKVTLTPTPRSATIQIKIGRYEEEAEIIRLAAVGMCRIGCPILSVNHEMQVSTLVDVAQGGQVDWIRSNLLADTKRILWFDASSLRKALISLDYMSK